MQHEVEWVEDDDIHEVKQDNDHELSRRQVAHQMDAPAFPSPNETASRAVAMINSTTTLPL